MIAISPARTKIDTGWRFHLGDTPEAQAEDFNDSGWRRLSLPHDWSIEGSFSPANAVDARFEAGHLEGRADSFLPKGIGWYRRELDVAVTGQRVYVEFEGVFRDSTVWVNGCRAGGHLSGYTGFVLDITDFLRCDGRPDILAVRVDARGMEGWWYEGSGIYRHVWLHRVHAVHAAPWGIGVSTPQVDHGRATVQVRTEVQNQLAGACTCSVRTLLHDPRGNLVACTETGGPVAAGAGQVFLHELTIDGPALWSPLEPRLYTACVEVRSPDGSLDRRTTTFGIRWFEFTPDQGFLLNGLPLQLRGGCIHHDFGGLGTALPDRANEKTIEVLKAMGANIVRSAHNAAAPALLDACDRLGLLVWAETRRLGSDAEAERTLLDQIHRDRNHPSIITWSLANIAGGKDGTLTTHLAHLHALARRTDPSRPTAVALEGNANANANGFAGVTDVVGYNGGGMGIDDRDHRLYPRRCMLISEYSSGRGTRGVYEAGPLATDELETFGDGRTMRRDGHYSSIHDLCISHEREWRHIAERPWLAGGIMWSAIEYRGETTGWPVVTSQFGVLDLCRFPKDAYHFYRKEWTPTPMLHLFPHWNWPGCEGRLIQVKCYTNCETVDLYLNDQLVRGIPHHRQFQTSWPHLPWNVIYQPGSLRAEGRLGGRVVCIQEIRTAGPPARLRLVPDRTSLRPDGEDLSFVTISVEDAAGTPVPTAACSVTVGVIGAGRLLGLASGDPASHESEKSDAVRLFSGLALAIVQAAEVPGGIVMTASSPGLESAHQELEGKV